MRRSGLAPAAALIACLGLAIAPAVGQSLAEDAKALAEAKRQALAAQRRSAALEAQAGDAEDAAVRARTQAAAIVSRIDGAEAEIATADARIRLVAALRAQQRARLAARQQPIVRLAAGLQTMARRPAALALVQRGSIADLVHVRAVLAAQLPIVRARTEPLRREVAEGVRLQAQADQAVATLRDGQRQLDEQRVRFGELERSYKNRAQFLIDRAMAEQDRATALGEEARDIVDEMGRVQQRAALAARLVALAGPLPRPPIRDHADIPAQDMAEIGMLPYRLPVSGPLLTGFGEVAESGVRARGLTLAVARGARVVAPAAGRVAYAGYFRNYGRIVIIAHRDGFTSLVTDMGALAVRQGSMVSAGSLLGRAAPASGGLTVELRHDGRPIDIVPMIASG